MSTSNPALTTAVDADEDENEEVDDVDDVEVDATGKTMTTTKVTDLPP